jgi:hypothetical protein
MGRHQPLMYDDFDLKVAREKDVDRRLQQPTYWVDANDKVHEVATMDRRHAANVLAWLERRAPALHEAAVCEMAMGPKPSGDAATEAFDSAYAELEAMGKTEADAIAWLHGTPLGEALAARAGEHEGGPSLGWVVRHPIKAWKQSARGA